MKPLPQNYDAKESEKRWQRAWAESGVYAWRDDKPRAETYVIDTPPPTVSGLLHMGHIFSYTQADFIARFQRMRGLDVFYPMGFDDNGLPTERLVEKAKKIRAADVGREKFIEECESVAEEARKEFRRLFESVALSVDWKQEYHTISGECRKISQLSFLDLMEKGHAYRKLQPMLWDPVDQTAIAQAEVVDKETKSHWNDIVFKVCHSERSEESHAAGDPSPAAQDDIIIGTTRPELLPACVAVLFHPEDERFNGKGLEEGIEGAIDLRNKTAITPLFGVKVPIIADEEVQKDKGTGLVMCCTFGDEQDIKWWERHGLPMRVVLNKFGKIDLPQINNFSRIEEIHERVSFFLGMEGFLEFIEKNLSEWDKEYSTAPAWSGSNIMALRVISSVATQDVIPAKAGIHVAAEQRITEDKEEICRSRGNDGSDIRTERTESEKEKPLSVRAIGIIQNLRARPSTGNPGASAREKIIAMLKEQNLLVKQEEISHAEPCAERSGAALEILPTHQWFVKILDKKEVLKQKVDACTWHPDYMRLRAHQWIDGLNWDWCISRQRFFGVPFPVWYSKRAGEEGRILLASNDKLPVNPLVDLPDGYNREEVEAEADVMDTWATSSVSPQLSSKGINRYASLRGSDSDRGNPEQEKGWIASPSARNDGFVLDAERHAKLFPADLRPQAHEIIRTWAFYTLVKAHLHEDTIPWKNLMISGWCLAADKTKMSKSKGNVITPVELIEEKGADAVRYWASTSSLGADTAFSEDALKIGRKLVTKLWNAAKFANIQLERGEQRAESTVAEDVASGIITEVLDKWILTRLYRAVAKATKEFEEYEYSRARAAIEDFFWNDFCDNYLEMAKGRAYDEHGQNKTGQQSAIRTIYHCLEGVLRLFAPIVPHITEELYSHIFAEKTRSIHARGMWPKAEDYPVDEAAEATGIAARQVLDEVRKAKAEAGVSIKCPVLRLGIGGGAREIIAPAFVDLSAVTSAAEIVWDEKIPSPLGGYSVFVRLAPAEKAI